MAEALLSIAQRKGGSLSLGLPSQRGEQMLVWRSGWNRPDIADVEMAGGMKIKDAIVELTALPPEDCIEGPSASPCISFNPHSSSMGTWGHGDIVTCTGTGRAHQCLSKWEHRLAPEMTLSGSSQPARP